MSPRSAAITAVVLDLIQIQDLRSMRHTYLAMVPPSFIPRHRLSVAQDVSIDRVSQDNEKRGLSGLYRSTSIYGAAVDNVCVGARDGSFFSGTIDSATGPREAR